jgi:hypothetical protein
MDPETYLQSEEYKINKQKIHEASVEKYRSHLPTNTMRDYIAQYIDSWRDLKLYLLGTYHHCNTDELKRLFFKEFFERRDKLTNRDNYKHIIDDLKDLICLYEGNTQIVFFKEFIEEKLKEHSDCNAQYTIEQYFCKSHNYEIHEYFVKKMSEQKTDYQKTEMTRRFIDESRCLSRPMNIEVFLKLREMEIDDFNKDLIT